MKYIISIDEGTTSTRSCLYNIDTKEIEKISNINSTISFIIGGSLGLSEEVLGRSNRRICFSKMTFPHQLMRIFLLEQIYRAFKISNNEKYHK